MEIRSPIPMMIRFDDFLCMNAFEKGMNITVNELLSVEIIPTKL